MALLNYDATGKEVREDYTPIPNGEYLAVCTEAEMVQNGQSSKDPSGQHLFLKWAVYEGPYENRVVQDRLNLINIDQKTVEIAYKTLNEILVALQPQRGKLSIADTSELCGQVAIIRVKTTPAKGQYGPSNGISKYLPYIPGASVGAAHPAQNGGTYAAPSYAQGQPPASQGQYGQPAAAGYPQPTNAGVASAPAAGGYPGQPQSGTPWDRPQ